MRQINTTIGDIPRSDLLYVDRYRGVKPMPRLVTVDGSVLACVFDIDQTQYYYEADDAPAVGKAGEHMMRFITGKGQEGVLARAVRQPLPRTSRGFPTESTVEADEVEITLAS